MNAINTYKANSLLYRYITSIATYRAKLKLNVGEGEYSHGEGGITLANKHD